MSTSSSPVFTGSSNFAGDLQQVIKRSIGIASLPITQLNSSKTTLQSQSAALTSLDSKVSALQIATTNLQTILQSPLVSASTSTTGVVASTLSTGARAGDYSIEVVSTGSYSSALSQSGSTAVSDPTTQGLSTSNDYTLSIGGVATSIHSKSASLNDVVDSINSQSNGAVQATIVNVGGSSAADYRISFRSAKLGAVDIGLNDGTSDLVSSQTAGTLASYKVNGLSTAVTSDSRTISLAPGVQVNLISASSTGESTVITVKQDATSIQNAFNNIATVYNAVVDELATHHGSNGGALQGQSILSSVGSTLRAISSYSGGSADSSLAAFGITVSSNGHLAVDATAFQAAASANYSGLVSLLGSTTKGGFLQSATGALNGLEDTTSGIFTTQEAQLKNQITSTQADIDAKQARIDLLQASLQAQLANADAAIATLEQQASYMTNLFASQRAYATQGY